MAENVNVSNMSFEIVNWKDRKKEESKENGRVGSDFGASEQVFNKLSSVYDLTGVDKNALKSKLSNTIFNNYIKKAKGGEKISDAKHIPDGLKFDVDAEKAMKDTLSSMGVQLNKKDKTPTESPIKPVDKAPTPQKVEQPKPSAETTTPATVEPPKPAAETPVQPKEEAPKPATETPVQPKEEALKPAAEKTRATVEPTKTSTLPAGETPKSVDEKANLFSPSTPAPMTQFKPLSEMTPEEKRTEAQQLIKNYNPDSDYNEGVVGQKVLGYSTNSDGNIVAKCDDGSEDTFSANNSKIEVKYADGLEYSYDSGEKSSIDCLLSGLRQNIDKTNDKQDGKIGSFKQGKTGDCWLLSGLKIISSKPEGAEIIKNSIKDNNNGTFTVSFKGAPDKQYIVSEQELKKGENYASGDKDVRILEIAADKWSHEKKRVSIDNGGSFMDANELLTGSNKLTAMSVETGVSGQFSRSECHYEMPTKLAVNKIFDGQYFEFGLASSNKLEKSPDSIATQGGKKIIAKHSYYGRKEGNNLIIYNPTDTEAEPIRMSVKEFLSNNYRLQFPN